MVFNHVAKLLVKVQPDHQMLELPESGTWEELSASHRDLTPPPSSPSGHPNIHRKVPGAFPAAVQLTGLGALSDALLGRRRWTDPAVLEGHDLLFSSDPETTRNASRSGKRALSINLEKRGPWAKKSEITAFGDKSYFIAKENGISTRLC
ncbi:MAG: hypothetical protein M1819_002650 [Sarea resinae]|nr:MAG: hypothetical protein M1819_002650 [Sarea resinae]